MDELETLRFVTIEFQGDDGGREIVTLFGAGYDAVFSIYTCTDTVFKAMAGADLFSMRSCDGKIVMPSSAGLAEWVNYLELEHSPIRILEGDIPTEDFIDPQFEIERSFAINLENIEKINEINIIAQELQKLADGAETDTVIFDQKLDELADRAEKAGAMEELDDLLHAAADKLSELLFKQVSALGIKI